MSFPVAPVNGEITTVNGIRYYYNSDYSAWIRLPNANLLPPQLDQLIQLWETTGTTQMKMYFMNGHLMAQAIIGLIYLQD